MGAPATRVVAAVALTVVTVAAAVLLLRSGNGDYMLRAQFTNAGRLVEGGDVRIAGRRVGSISRIGLTHNGLAEVTLSIGDQSTTPLPRGTQAWIRAVGAATITNNFVELTPGPSRAPRLRSGATLPPEATHGIVDIDALLSSIGPQERADIRHVLANSADAFAGSGARWFNGMLAQLGPTMAELTTMSADLNSDQADLARFVSTTAQAASAIGSRRQDLVSAVDNTARTLAALNRERVSLGSAIERGPAVLRQTASTLDRATATLTELRPTLRSIPPAARPLRGFLDRMLTLLPRLRPVARQVVDQAPDLRRGLASLPSLQRPAVAALSSTGQAFERSRPILRGFRYYAPDFLIGIFNGLVALANGNFNKSGHYLHVSFLQAPQGLTNGLFANALTQRPLAPGLFELKGPFTRMCPGGGAAPAPDGSNPFVPPDTIRCDPTQSMSPIVNTP